MGTYRFVSCILFAHAIIVFPLLTVSFSFFVKNKKKSEKKRKETKRTEQSSSAHSMCKEWRVREGEWTHLTHFTHIIDKFSSTRVCCAQQQHHTILMNREPTEFSVFQACKPIILRTRCIVLMSTSQCLITYEFIITTIITGISAKKKTVCKNDSMLLLMDCKTICSFNNNSHEIFTWNDSIQFHIRNITSINPNGNLPFFQQVNVGQVRGLRIKIIHSMKTIQWHRHKTFFLMCL